ncbi:MAG TPA: COQ9 family protein, partial [Kiloniellales bacterium]
KMRDRIAVAVRTRLELLAAHREAVRRGVAFLALPINAPLGLKCVYRTVDAIWYAAGDTATDYNFYSKRLLLAGVYSATLLFWLNDASEGSAATWAFLGRRIAEVLKVGRSVGRTMTALLDFPDRLFAFAQGRRRRS